MSAPLQWQHLSALILILELAPEILQELARGVCVCDNRPKFVRTLRMPRRLLHPSLALTSSKAEAGSSNLSSVLRRRGVRGEASNRNFGYILGTCGW